MPLYEYQCDACGKRFERIQKFSDPLVSVCPECGGPVQKLVSSPAIQFKGSGFYITDYAKSKGSGESKGDTAGADGSSGSEKTDKKDKKEPAAASSDAAKSDGSTSKSESAKPAASTTTKE